MSHISSDADIERIGRGLIDRSLPKAEWTHAAHFAAAFWLLSHPERDALRDMPGLIRAYNEATGTPNTDTGGYHETLTRLYVTLISQWLAGQESREDWPALVRHLLESRLVDKQLPLEFYSRERLFSSLARHTWTEPDRQPLVLRSAAR